MFRITRRSLFSGMAPAAWAGSSRFEGPVGLELYSLRRNFAKDVPGTLALARKMGFEEVEVSGYYGLDAGRFRTELDQAGLRCTAMIPRYDQLRDELPLVISDARTLGATFVICPWIPHKGDFTVEQARQEVGLFNSWGERLRQQGLSFCFHPHGYEFQREGDGTVFDVMAKEMKPGVADFEMDIFWIAYPGQDPVKYLRRYPGRFPLMHLKDMRRGTTVGDHSGKAPDEVSVALGDGALDLPAILRAAGSAGVKRYYIEDESPLAETQIPLSLKYLRSLSWK